LTVLYCEIISFILNFFLGGPDSNYKPIDKKDISKIINKNLTELSTPPNKEVQEAADVHLHEEATMDVKSQMEVTTLVANPDGQNATAMCELSEGIGKRSELVLSVCLRLCLTH